MVILNVGIGTAIFATLGIIRIHFIGKNGIKCIPLMSESGGEMSDT
jgi:hypothetical protein